MVAELVVGARGALSATMHRQCEASFGEVPAEPLTVVATSVCVIGTAILLSEPWTDWWVVRFVGLSTGRRQGPAGVHWRLAARQAGGVCVGAVDVGRSCSLLLRGSGQVALIAAREGTARSDERSSPPAAWREILGVVGYQVGCVGGYRRGQDVAVLGAVGHRRFEPSPASRVQASVRKSTVHFGHDMGERGIGFFGAHSPTRQKSGAVAAQLCFYVTLPHRSKNSS